MTIFMIAGIVFMVMAIVFGAYLSRQEFGFIEGIGWMIVVAMMGLSIITIQETGRGRPADDILSTGAVYQIKGSYADSTGKVAVIKTTDNQILLIRYAKSQPDLADGKLYVAINTREDGHRVTILQPFQVKE